LHAIVNDSTGPASSPILLSLLFASGLRPRAAEVAEHAARRKTFTVSHRPEGEGDWLELLVNGLTFDLRSLAPAEPAEPFGFVHRFAVQEANDIARLEAVTLEPGPHLAGAGAMPPIVRGAAGLAAALAELPGCVAVGWRPARTLAGAAHFSRSVESWLAGGAFPALALTALTRDASGSVLSEGLAFLIGRELRIEASGAAAAEDAKLAIRLIDMLVESGSNGVPATVEAMPGVSVRLREDAARFIQARRDKP
jgi:hypothetical protein